MTPDSAARDVSEAAIDEGLVAWAAEVLGEAREEHEQSLMMDPPYVHMATRLLAKLQRQSRDNDATATALLNSLFYYDDQNDVHVFAYAEQRIIVRDDEYMTQLHDAVERLNPQEQS